MTCDTLGPYQINQGSYPPLTGLHSESGMYSEQNPFLWEIPQLLYNLPPVLHQTASRSLAKLPPFLAVNEAVEGRVDVDTDAH